MFLLSSVMAVFFFRVLDCIFNMCLHRSLRLHIRHLCTSLGWRDFQATQMCEYYAYFETEQRHSCYGILFWQSSAALTIFCHIAALLRNQFFHRLWGNIFQTGFWWVILDSLSFTISQQQDCAWNPRRLSLFLFFIFCPETKEFSKTRWLPEY